MLIQHCARCVGVQDARNVITGRLDHWVGHGIQALNILGVRHLAVVTDFCTDSKDSDSGISLAELQHLEVQE